MEKISGKTGRVTFTTLAMNNGVSAESTSIATKHRDPKTMLGYVAADEQLMMQAAKGIGKAMKGSSSNSTIAGVDFLPSDFEESSFDDDVYPDSAPLNDCSSSKIDDEEPARKKSKPTVVKKTIIGNSSSGSHSTEKTVIFNIHL